MGLDKKSTLPASSISEEAQDLVRLVFERGIIRYTNLYEIHADGIFWPREMRAAIQVIDLFKEQNKESNRRTAEKSQ